MKRVALAVLFALAVLIPAVALATAPDSAPAGVSGPASQSIVIPGAPSLPDPDSNLASFAGAMLSAASGKQWGSLASLLLLGLVFVGRRFGARFIPFLGTDRGGALLSLLGGFALAVAAAATAPGAHGVLSVIATALLLTVSASGTYSVLRKLLFPSGADAAQLIKAKASKVESDAAQGGAAGAINAAIKS